MNLKAFRNPVHMWWGHYKHLNNRQTVSIFSKSENRQETQCTCTYYVITKAATRNLSGFINKQTILQQIPVAKAAYC